MCYPISGLNLKYFSRDYNDDHALIVSNSACFKRGKTSGVGRLGRGDRQAAKYLGKGQNFLGEETRSGKIKVEWYKGAEPENPFRGSWPVICVQQQPAPCNVSSWCDGLSDRFFIVTFYLRLYGIAHMVKDDLDNERGNPLQPHGLLFPICSKGSFICTVLIYFGLVFLLLRNICFSASCVCVYVYVCVYMCVYVYV